MDRHQERFLRKVIQQSNGCWKFSGKIRRDGYAQISFKGKLHRAHRAYYKIFVGDIPDGMHIDHTCHDPEKCAGGPQCEHRSCMNPAHMQPTTKEVNFARRVKRPGNNRLEWTHCPKGHEYTPQNTKPLPGGKRHCRTCLSLTQKRADLKRPNAHQRMKRQAQ